MKISAYPAAASAASIDEFIIERSGTSLRVNTKQILNAPIAQQISVIYVGKHGDDDKDGRNLVGAKLTFAGARAQIVANGDAGAAHLYVIWCGDAGIYAEDVVGLSFVDIWAPGATINPVTTHTMVDGVSWRIGRIVVATALTGFTKIAGAGLARLKTSFLDCEGTAAGFFCTSGKISVDIKQVNVVDGYGIGAAGLTSELDVTVRAITITGTGIGIGTAGAGAILDAKIGCIDDGGAGTGIYLANLASTINAIVARIDCNTAYDVGAAATLNLVCSNVTGIITGNINIIAVKENMPPIPIEWALDGTTPPDAVIILTNTSKIPVREFQGAVANQDVLVPWPVPKDLIGGTVKFRVRGYISNAVVPAAGETVIFTLAGTSIGNSENLNKALGAAVSATFTADATYAQYDRWATVWSGDVTVTDLLADEDVHFQLIRDQASDTYAQKIGAAFIDIEYTRMVGNS